VIQTTQGTDGGIGTTVSDAPQLVSPYDVSVNILASRTYPAFRQAVIVAQILPPSLMGDYHLAGPTSPAYGTGAASTTVTWGTTTSTTPLVTPWTYVVNAPTPDIDGDPRPSASLPSRYDAGSDQLVP